MAKKDFSSINTDNIYNTIAEATEDTKAPKKTAKAKAQEEQPKELKTSRLNLLLTPSNHEFLKVMARITGKSTNDFINSLIEKQRENMAEEYKQALAILKKFE